VIKRITFRIVAALAALAAAALVVELLANAFLLVRDGRYIPARARLDALNTNTFITGVTNEKAGCRYVDTLYPHPYLGFVHHGNPPCGVATVNNIGLFGPDFPSDRPSDRFVVLVTGGSVANQLVMAGPGGSSYLQAILDRDYTTPTGRPLLLLNGADGGWHQPQQLILFLLYADAVHAVVTIDGFNERYFVGSTERFEYPGHNFLDVNPLVSSGFSDVVKRWMAGKLYGRVQRSAVLSRSQIAYLLLARINAYLNEQQAVYYARERTNLNTMLALPADWDEERRIAWADGQYRKYIRAMDAVAAQHDVLVAHFIQPVPAIKKPLTEDERRVVGDLDYRQRYQRIAADVLSLAHEGAPVFSLLELFEHHPGSVYADSIHLRQEADGSSEGYRLMAERIAEVLASTWKLRPRRPGTATAGREVAAR